MKCRFLITFGMTRAFNVGVTLGKILLSRLADSLPFAKGRGNHIFCEAVLINHHRRQQDDVHVKEIGPQAAPGKENGQHGQDNAQSWDNASP